MKLCMNLQGDVKKVQCFSRSTIFHSLQVRSPHNGNLLVCLWNFGERIISQCKTHLVTGRVVEHVEKIVFKRLSAFTHFDHNRRHPGRFVYKIVQVILVRGRYQHSCRQWKLCAISRVTILILIFPAQLGIIPVWICMEDF